MTGQFLLDTVHCLQRHPVALPQIGRTVRAIQYKYSFAIRREDMNVGGAVIVYVDSHAQAIEAKDSRHWQVYNPIAWVFQEMRRTRAGFGPLKTFNNCLGFERRFWRQQTKRFATVPKTSVFGTSL